MHYIYSLDKSSKKFVCPQCGEKRFVRYVDTETNQYINCKFGRCDRDNDCAYHAKPDNPQKQRPAIQPPIKQPTYYIPKDIYQQTLTHYNKNNLVTFLNKLFSTETVNNVIRNYRLGTSKKWPGATLYWQINCKGQIGQGKIMLHDPDTGKRVKHPYPHVSSVHAQLNKQEQKPEMCYFGEHLLALHPNKSIAIVESEKTAVIMSAINNRVLWVATGSLSNLNTKRLKPFKQRTLILYPDLGAYKKWQQKADEIKKYGYDISISDLLEQKAAPDDIKEGYDIADYFIKQRLLASENKESEQLKIMKTKEPALQLFIDTFNLQELHAHGGNTQPSKGIQWFTRVYTAIMRNSHRPH